ncbi:MAG: LysR family transcriptional regulator [Paracoccaceae bacterium]|uniref:LysR family transcriptional regulator n=1 Tax=Shimia thalassica TaxID=1715693 RepID=UPI00329A108A
MPSLAALRAFDAVAFCKSYSEAARLLNVTEAAMRQHVRNLEKALGYSLVERKGRGLSLTENGERLSATTSQSFENLFDCIIAMTSENQQKPVKVALPPSFAENWLMPRLTSFWVDHPAIEVELAPSLRILDLRQEDVDFAIRYGDGNWSDGTSTYLASAEFVVVGRPDIIGENQGQNLSTLKALPWLFEVSRTEHRVWAEARGINFDASQNRHFPTNSLVISAARTGQGLSVQSRALVEGDLANGSLVEVKSEAVQQLGYYLVIDRDLRQPALALTNWLLK